MKAKKHKTLFLYNTAVNKFLKKHLQFKSSNKISIDYKNTIEDIIVTKN